MTELAIREAAAVVPAANDTDSWITVVRDIIKIADVIYDTPFVPDGLRGSSPAVAAAMLAGREMGLGIMTSLANIDVIRGKPTQKALLMRAMIQSRGHKWQDGDVNDTRAVVRGCRKGESEWTEVTFTAEQARRAGLDLGKYPADKLYARATSRLARRKFADVIMGMPYSAEELEDGDVAEEGIAATPAAIEPPKPAPRTAKRRTPAAKAEHAPAAPAPEQEHQEPGETLPPLPGEEEPSSEVAKEEVAQVDDYHRRLVGVVQGHMKRLGFAVDDDDRDERLPILAKLAGIAYDTEAVFSTSDFDEDELKTIADTLARCKNRAALDTLLAAGETDE